MNESEFEKKYVQEVYNEIAEHFSNTRYKAWPVVQRFLTSQNSGSVGLDCGCGNGKNMRVNQNLFTIGIDNSVELLKFAYKNDSRAPVLIGDIRCLPFKVEIFDFTISIAVLHHLSNPFDRQCSIREMLRVLKSEGIFLIFVWAAEQEAIYKTPGLEALNENRDYLVPWHSGEKLFKRFYHLFKKGELEELLESTGKAFTIIESGYDRDNWFIIGKKGKI